MADAAPNAHSGKVVIRNIGLLLSGDIDKPILSADTIVVRGGLIAAVGKGADLDTDEPVFMGRAQHSAGATLLESVQQGDLPGVGMVMIDGIVRCGRSRNTPPATEVPVVVGGR